MATYTKFQPFIERPFEGVVNFATDQLTIALTAAANAPVNTNAVLADLTEIAYTNLSSRNLVTASSSQSGGTYSLVVNDLVLTASGGAVATFRYTCIYDNTPTSPADPLIAFWDYAGNVTLAQDETFTVDFGATLFTAT